jgi:hypothetical protein
MMDVNIKRELIIVGGLILVFVTAAFALVLLEGCGGEKWTALDENDARDIVEGSKSQDVICARDGGTCPGFVVRQMGRAVCVSASSMLYRHGASDGGDGCTQ